MFFECGRQELIGIGTCPWWLHWWYLIFYSFLWSHLWPWDWVLKNSKLEGTPSQCKSSMQQGSDPLGNPPFPTSQPFLWSINLQFSISSLCGRLHGMETYMGAGQTPVLPMKPRKPNEKDGLVFCTKVATNSTYQIFPPGCFIVRGSWPFEAFVIALNRKPTQQKCFSARFVFFFFPKGPFEKHVGNDIFGVFWVGSYQPDFKRSWRS